MVYVKKGYSHYWKGKKLSDETRKKMSDVRKGKRFSEKSKKKMSDSHKGYIMPESQKKKISEVLKKMFKEGKLKIKGCVLEYSKDPKKHHRYIDGRSYIVGPSRYGDDWDAIRMLIYVRDNFKCQECGINMHESKQKYGTVLHIHHKIPFLKSWDNSPNNLITLCVSCHRKAENKIKIEVDS
jgi:5-methylcytosine-specific restriction endonuclease McrA